MSPPQLRVIAGASAEVIARHYEHLTAEDVDAAMIDALTQRRSRPGLPSLLAETRRDNQLAAKRSSDLMEGRDCRSVVSRFESRDG